MRAIHAAVCATVTMEQALKHYGVWKSLKYHPNCYMGCCPIHKGTYDIGFRVDVQKNTWGCCSNEKCCRRGGNVIDFIAGMEKTSRNKAALKAIEWFHRD